MAKPTSIYGYLTNPSMVDYPGHLSAVFFVSGCNFSCGFCHNAALLGAPQPGLSREGLDAACREFDQQWVKAAVVSGGEPTLANDLPELLQGFRQRGWAVKLDTNGSRPEVLRQIIPLVDYVAMDIKCPLAQYPQLTGFRQLDAIRQSVDLIKQQAPDYEFRTTIIPGVHDEAAMQQLAPLLTGAKRYILQPFVPKPGLLDPAFETLPRTSPDLLNQILMLPEFSGMHLTIRGA